MLLIGGYGHGSFRFLSIVPFDDRLRFTRLVDAVTRADSASLAYPPYNIEKTGEDAYRLTMAVAGFSPTLIRLALAADSVADIRQSSRAGVV